MEINGINSVSIMNPLNNNYNIIEQTSTASIQETYLQNNVDSISFSINYGDSEVSSILKSIQGTFDNYIPGKEWFDYSHEFRNMDILNLGNQYGEVYKKINMNSNLDGDTKTQLTKLLDNSFDNLIQTKAGIVTSQEAVIFNGYYKSSEASYLEKLGGDSTEIIDVDNFKENIAKISSSIKVFYKSNIDGTTEQLDNFLQNKFSETNDINNLSYNDFQTLYNVTLGSISKSISRDVADSLISNNFKCFLLSREKQLESLKESGASSCVIDAFEKGTSRNKDIRMRAHAFILAGRTWGKPIYELEQLDLELSIKLKSVDDTRKENIKEYEKELSKLKQDLHEMKLQLSVVTGDSYKNDSIEEFTKQIEEFTKQHEKTLNRFEELENNIAQQKSEIHKQLKQLREEYKAYKANPKDVINEYIGKYKEEIMEIE